MMGWVSLEEDGRGVAQAGAVTGWVASAGAAAQQHAPAASPQSRDSQAQPSHAAGTADSAGQAMDVAAPQPSTAEGGGPVITLPGSSGVAEQADGSAAPAAARELRERSGKVLQCLAHRQCMAH